jgi:hypothetical protein
MMTSPVFAAIVSAGVSFLVAWLTAKRTLRTEELKLRLATESSVFQKLTEARLSCYPKLWPILNQLAWRADRSPADLQRIRASVEEWDAAYAILLGPSTVNRMYEFRQALRRAPSADAQSSLFDLAQELEIGLRSDLGIYGFVVNPKTQGLRVPRVSDYDSGEQQ